MIKYLRNIDIDKSKWDNCVKSSIVSVPYAYSWYLDLASPGWDALVLDNYSAVMPLTQRKKFGILYLYQPIMCQQLGVFSSIHSSTFFVDDFIESIPSKYWLAEIYLNKHNAIETQAELSVSERSNFLLSLNHPYEYLYSNFSKSHRKNIDKATNSGVIVLKGNMSFDEFYALKVDNFSNLGVNLKIYQKQDYFTLFKELDRRGLLKLYTAHYNNQVVGSACFILIDGWVTLQSFNTDIGKQLAVGYAIVNQFIEDHAGQSLTLDFMGSNIQGIAFHNKGYGSVEEKYPYLKISKLPKIMRLFKR